jgi:hypothetical protein
VDLISEYEYDLFIRPDTCNPRFRLWFNFIVDNIRMDQVSHSLLQSLAPSARKRLTGLFLRDECAVTQHICPEFQTMLFSSEVVYIIGSRGGYYEDDNLLGLAP